MYEISVINTSPAALFLTRKKTVWYSFCDGEWNNPNTWISNSLDHRLINYPQFGDDVYINHKVNYSNSLYSVYLFNPTIKNLYIGPNGTLTATSSTSQNYLGVTGDLQCSGLIDFGSSVSSITVELRGTNNFIVSFICGTKSNIYYSSTLPQNIVNVIYYNLTIDNSIKTIVADLTVNGQTSINSSAGSLELSSFNSYFNGVVSLSGELSKVSGTGTVNFYNTLTSPIGGIISFSGNPVINMYANMTGDWRSGCNMGSNTWNVLENLAFQLNGSSNVPIKTGTNNVIIASGKTLTINGLFGSTTSNGGGWINSGTVTGADSTAILNVIGTYSYGAANIAMATGTFNYNFSGISNIQVESGVTMSLPFNSYYALTINGGLVTLGSNTVVSQNLNINSGGLECATYDLTVMGGLNYAGNLSKSGSGTVSLDTISTQNSTGKIDFSAGNPTVNLSGNVSGDVRAGFNFGSGIVNINASITIGVWVGGNIAPAIGWNILIASGVTFTNIGISNSMGGLNMTGTLNGADSTSIFINKSVLGYSNATAPMGTGNFYCNQASNIVDYQALGNQNIQIASDPISPGYYNLTLSGSGTKTLLGNISVKNTYTLVTPTTLNTNGFVLTNP